MPLTGGTLGIQRWPSPFKPSFEAKTPKGECLRKNPKINAMGIPRAANAGFLRRQREEEEESGLLVLAKRMRSSWDCIVAHIESSFSIFTLIYIGCRRCQAEGDRGVLPNRRLRLLSCATGGGKSRTCVLFFKEHRVKLTYAEAANDITLKLRDLLAKNSRGGSKKAIGRIDEEDGPGDDGDMRNDRWRDGMMGMMVMGMMRISVAMMADDGMIRQTNVGWEMSVEDDKGNNRRTRIQSNEEMAVRCEGSGESSGLIQA
ncbi:uncharacterized protein A4U43_C01F34380 [Asparagus officinalis]|uniref:Uncharacterized protein n=1 Tax=Asparagus officinalis TaxID=4686 RepID=A0A5P1FXK3_ASPOF|nr:uncharacterized protein A4U43_C01F34380 [Asparagus officinalis]